MAKYRWIGDHAEQVSVGDRRVPVAPGDFVDLSPEDTQNPDNVNWLENGLLMDVATATVEEGDNAKTGS